MIKIKKWLLRLFILLVGTIILFGGTINDVVVFAEQASSSQIETDAYFSELHQQTRLYHTSEESYYFGCEDYDDYYAAESKEDVWVSGQTYAELMCVTDTWDATSAPDFYFSDDDPFV